MKVGDFGNYIPVIDESKCTSCRLCVRACPGHGFDYYKEYEEVHGEVSDNIALGKSIEGFAGYTSDAEILEASQSGGFVSTILIYCLEKDIIDGAAVTRWCESSPFVPETYIARKREDIIKAVGSKYNPVPAAQIVGDLLNQEGKFAFVGTSCQIQAMRKVEKIYPELTDKIALYIGLHCLGVFTFHFHERVLSQLRLDREKVATFRHRDKSWKGWPCDMRIKDKDGSIFDIDAKNSRLWPRPFYTNWRCQLCFDKANEFSDISCGDCRMPEMIQKYKDDGYKVERGLSELVIRTDRGKDIFSDLLTDQRFNVMPADLDLLARSIGVSGKKLGISIFIKIASIFRLGVPEYGVQFTKKEIEELKKWKFLKPWNFVSSSRYLLTFRLNRCKALRVIGNRIPSFFLKILDTLFSYGVEWMSFSNDSVLLRKKDIKDKGGRK